MTFVDLIKNDPAAAIAQIERAPQEVIKELLGFVKYKGEMEAIKLTVDSALDKMPDDGSESRNK